MRLFGFLLVLLFFAGCLPEGKRESSVPAEITIANEVFIIPSDWQYWRYDELTDPNRGNAKYNQLWFDVDENTFTTIKPDYKDVHGISIEVRPIRSEFGESRYWTDKDRVHEAKTFNCSDYDRNGEMYEVCEHESKHQLSSWASNNYKSIKDKQLGNYISVMGCSTKYNNLNQICTGRAIAFGEIQVEYGYRAEHFPRAVEIDFKIRELILSLRKESLSKEGKL